MRREEGERKRAHQVTAVALAGAVADVDAGLAGFVAFLLRGVDGDEEGERGHNERGELHVELGTERSWEKAMVEREYCRERPSDCL